MIVPRHDSEKQKWGRHGQMVTGSFLIPTNRDGSQESKADHKSWHPIFQFQILYPQLPKTKFISLVNKRFRTK